MNNKLLPGATALALMTTLSTGVLATPVYDGPTSADFGTYPSGLGDTIEAGYYIWSSNEGIDWSVRWTGNDEGTSGSYDWFGTINLQNLENDSLVSVNFENGDDSFTNIPDKPESTPFEFVSFEAIAGPFWDGFDFSLVSPKNTQVIDFALGTTFWELPGSSLKNVQGTGIFIGENFSTPLVQIQDYTVGDVERQVQRFEVTQVPEPGTFALMGLGLLGLGLRLKKRSA